METYDTQLDQHLYFEEHPLNMTGWCYENGVYLTDNEKCECCNERKIA